MFLDLHGLTLVINSIKNALTRKLDKTELEPVVEKINQNKTYIDNALSGFDGSIKTEIEKVEKRIDNIVSGQLNIDDRLLGQRFEELESSLSEQIITGDNTLDSKFSARTKELDTKIDTSVQTLQTQIVSISNTLGTEATKKNTANLDEMQRVLIKFNDDRDI